MNVLLRPCIKLIQRSYEIRRVSALTNLYKVNTGSILDTHTSKCFTSTHIVGTEAEDGKFKRFIKKITNIDNSKTRLRVSSYVMYEGVADSINYQEIFLKFNLPNTFNTWFIITELHVWMLMVRAMAEGPEKGQDGKFMRNCIVEALWVDVNKRAKQLNPGNPSEMRNQIQIISEQFQAALITYDEGVMSDDKVLANALWRRFFEMKCDNYEHLEIMVRYVRKQIKLLDSLSRQDFVIKPKVHWTDMYEV